MADKKFVIWLAEGVHIRVELILEQGQVSDLMIQLEVLEEKWKGVVRYNYAHGVPHRDILFRDGKKTKELLNKRNLNFIAQEAIEDLKNNWVLYLRRCGYAKD